MFKKSLLTAGLVAASIAQVHALPYGFYDARSVGMGNVSMATGGITTAAFSNPGMLSVNENDDTVALLLPAIGAQVIEDGDVVNLVDEFQSIGVPQTPGELDRQIGILNELDGASLVAAIIPNAAFVYSGDSFTWGISVRGDAVLSTKVTNVFVPTLAQLAANNSLTPDALTRNLGVAIAEVGVPIGTDIDVAGMQLAVGVTPRYVQVKAAQYFDKVSTASIDKIQDEEIEDLGSFTTFDAGVTLNIANTFRVGFVAKNLIENSKTTTKRSVVLNGQTYTQQSTINFDTQYRIGAAFDAGFFTLAADMDLNERKPIGFENPSRSLSVGAEFDAFSIAQLRVGYQSNLAEGATDPDLLSVGLGLWLGFNLDVAAVIGDDSSYGAFVQTGFHF